MAALSDEPQPLSDKVKLPSHPSIASPAVLQANLNPTHFSPTGALCDSGAHAGGTGHQRQVSCEQRSCTQREHLSGRTV